MEDVFMDKSKLLFSDAYEYFYDVVEQNEVFTTYANNVFGIDFSQDGFSDINQVNDFIKAAAILPEHKVLDIGCGNGKMAEYIADRTKASVYGFDYSDNAINNAKTRTIQKSKLNFEVGLIGEMQYPHNMFDVILSVDTMYFAEDMESFVRQIYNWLKPNGIFIAYYGEGHMKKISIDENSTELASAFRRNEINYEVVDYTKEHYE
jgi:2-polyprenyl-3-methyl-5-hydroxy-6-metoxy-1,4-benzoquinol methylase